MSDLDIPLLGAAYNALVENVAYAQDQDSYAEGLRVVKALAERLGIVPEGDVAEALRDV